MALQETYLYARTLLDCATANADGRARALVVGGGIANFTDVAATFKGIIQVKLLRRSQTLAETSIAASSAYAAYSAHHSFF